MVSDSDEEIVPPGFFVDPADFEYNIKLTYVESSTGQPDNGGAAKRMAPEESNCVDGSGDFKVIPWYVQDADADGLETTVYKMVQMNGSGTLTGAAWIDTLEILDDDGFDFYIGLPNTPYQINPSNDMVNTSNLLNLSTSTSTYSFATGTVSATAPLITVEQDITSGISSEINLEWTCDTSPPGNLWISQPDGYVFNTSDCNSSYIQNMVIRPIPTNNPNRLLISLYGHVHGTYTVLLNNVGSNKVFSIDEFGVEIDGRWIGLNGSNAEIEFTSDVSYGINTVCSSGTYTLSPE